MNKNDEYSQYAASCQDRGVLPCSRESFEADAARPAATSGDAPDLQQLKALALAATPGPWDWGGTECNSQEQALAICKANLDATAKPGTHFCEVFVEDGRRTALVGNGPTGIENAAYIAAANPAVVLGLIARIERSNAEFKNFHRSLCARFGYTHDDHHWKRDQVSLEEHIAARIERAASPATASGDELPPLKLPKARMLVGTHLDSLHTLYSAEQVEAIATDYARAAVSAATKPTADLNALVRFSYWHDGAVSGIAPADDGNFVMFDDVQSILATKPAASRAVPEDAIRMIQAIADWKLPPTGDTWPSGGPVSYEAKHGTNGARDYMRQMASRALLSVYAATPAASTIGAAQTADQVRDHVRDAVAEALSGTYYCNRVWSAWSVGTMSEDDFTPANEDDDILDGVVDAVFGTLRPTTTHNSEAGVTQTTEGAGK